jgi:hypothetical protein
MAISEISFVLSAYHGHGRPNSREEFLHHFGISTEPYSFRKQLSATAAICLEIGALRIADYEEFGTEAPEELEKAIQKCLTQFANWLAAIPTENIERLRQSGMKVWVICKMWIDQDQMEFNLFPPLSAQLGRLGLQFYLITNE